MTDYKHVLAFDPGGTTGWAYGVYSDTTALQFVDGGQIPNGCPGFVEWFKHDKNIGLLRPDVLVSESFQLRPGVKSPDVTPLRIEGAITALWGTENVVWQQPAQKSLIPDELLRERGLWIKGQRHQMDARIHLAGYVIRQHHKPTSHRFFPDGHQANGYWENSILR